MHALTPAQVIEVGDALLKGFNEEWQLESLLATAVNVSLALEIGKGHPLRKMVTEIFNFTEAQGTTELLLREAAYQRPDNRFIQELVKRFGLAPAALSNVRLVNGAPIQPQHRAAYEAILLRKAGMVKPGAWRRDMVEREAAVCQILYRGDAIGTGFLVAPDRIMSNWHVFELQGKSDELGPLNDYSARFDYRAAEDTAPYSLGKTVAIDAACGYLATSPKSELDYVVVQLTEKAGDEVLSGTLKRGWLRPSSRTLETQEPILVLQHPKGRTLELAIGVVAGWAEGRESEVYAHWANTEEGSSGSPCFTVGWDLAALHHRADPTERSGANRAIAMAAVLQDMGYAGTLDLLPGVA